jgi:amino acid transporter
MNNQSKNGLVKTRINWGVYSSILGIISIISALGLSYFWGTYGWKNWDIFLVGMLLSAAFSVTGLGLGAKGLKSPGRIYSKAGIVMCVLGLLFCLYSVYAWLSTDPW